MNLPVAVIALVGSFVFRHHHHCAIHRYMVEPFVNIFPKTGVRGIARFV